MATTMTGSPLDELIDYKNKVINLIENSPAVMGLLVGKQDVDLDDKLVIEAYNSQIFDYSFTTETQLEEKSLILVETETKTRRGVIKDMTIYVQVIVHKDHMRLTGFKGVKGNRRDNLSRCITKLLEGNKDFGIGRLQMMQCYPTSVPSPYSSTMIVFEVSDLVKNGERK